jgi:hypothetical protein
MAGFAKSLFGLSKPKGRVPDVAPPVIDDGAELRKRRQALQRMAFQLGRTSGNTRGGTLLTGPSGLASPARKSLLGE